jgi:hypothetical protein
MLPLQNACWDVFSRERTQGLGDQRQSRYDEADAFALSERTLHNLGGNSRFAGPGRQAKYRPAMPRCDRDAQRLQGYGLRKAEFATGHVALRP